MVTGIKGQVRACEDTLSHPMKPSIGNEFVGTFKTQPEVELKSEEAPLLRPQISLLCFITTTTSNGCPLANVLRSSTQIDRDIR